MTFWFDTAEHSWAIERDDDPQPRRGPRGAFAALLIVFAGAVAATGALQFLGG